jgi:hypothetical protein
VVSLKALDPDRPIREADITGHHRTADQTTRARIGPQKVDRLALGSRNHLDQNYKLSLHRLIFDGGIGAHQSEAEKAIEDGQALDV